MTLKALKATVKHYTKNKDYDSARNYIINFGEQFKDYDSLAELKKIDELIKKEE